LLNAKHFIGKSFIFQGYYEVIIELKSMTEFLYDIDKALFYFINHTLSNPLFDKLMPFLTDPKHWFIAYVILLGILYTKGGRVGKIATVGTIFLIAFSDQLSSNLLKHLFERIRPCNALPDVNILVFCSSSYSFPSSHAVNNFAAAAYFARLFPKYRIVLYSTASIIAFTRPYVGVHYVSDIVAGALIGLAVGYLFSEIVIFIERKWDNYDKQKQIGD